MGIELLEIEVKMRKAVIFAIRGCFRSVCNHPFLVGVLCFFLFLYKLSPFIFSLLVSGSPILVCTAVLLGVLLSYGQPNIPEIEVEEKTTFEAVSLKTGISSDDAVIEKNESYYVERFSENTRDEAEQSTEQPDLSEGRLVLQEESSDYAAQLIEERSREIESNDGEIWEAKREFGGLRYKQKMKWTEEEGFDDGEVPENRYAKVNDELVESDDEKSEADSFDSEMVNVDTLDSPPRSPWKRVEEQEDKEEEEEEEEEEEDEEEEEEEDDASDSESDDAESSSPDASMADIMPMLDELHPLLEEEGHQPVHTSRGGSSTASEKSVKSSISSHESDDDEAENHEDLEVADDENEDGEDDENEDEQDAQGDEEKQTKSAITWTEEDQKNLMDLGSSEIERNQRLENLILRRRARKTMSMLAERNLIDFESSDLPFNIPPISTRRQNPFDLPLDSYDDLGLPPIPGSAPSILLPRRNPFDIPYDSSEERPNLMADGFQEEFTSQPRETFFRRHESFNVRPSVFAPNRQDFRMRPYFVPEGTVSEESSYSPFQRQSSELSESKVSSVPETESVCSVSDLEERKLSEEDNPLEVEAITSTGEVTEQITEEIPSVEPVLISQEEEFTEEDIYQAPEPISKMECVSEHVGHGSQFSEEEEEDSLELGQGGKGDTEVRELELEAEIADHSRQRGINRATVVPSTENNSNYEGVEHRYSRDSSSSSLSEESERVFIDTEGDGLSIFDGRGDGVAEEPSISIQTRLENTDFRSTTSSVHEIPSREPVYDSSPREVRRNFSSSSISSDVNPESDLGFYPVSVNRTVSFTGRESEGSGQEMETVIPSNIHMLSESYPVDESRPTDVVNIREQHTADTDLSEVDQISESEGSSAAPGIKSQVAIEASVEENLLEQHRLDEVSVPSAGENIRTSSESSEDQNLDKSEQEKDLLTERESPIEVNEPPVEVHLQAEHAIGMEETSQSPDSDAGVYREADMKLIATPAAEGNTSLFDAPIVKSLNEVQASCTTVELSRDVLESPNSDVPEAEVQELDNDISPSLNSLLIAEFIPIPTSATETTSPHADMEAIIEEAFEIKEIDEGLLSELDSVGDFSIDQRRSGSSELRKQADSVGTTWSSVHHTETSTTRVVELDSVEENEIEDALLSENSREYIVTHEEEMEYISEPQTSKSEMEFDKRDGQDSPDQETSEDKTLSNKNEVYPVHYVVNLSSEDNISEIPELEVGSAEDADSVSKKSELISVETETDAAGMAKLEATTIEDTDVAFREISDKDIEKTVRLGPSQAEIVVGETKTEHSAVDGALNTNSSAVDPTHDTSVLEVGQTEDAYLDYKQLNDSSTENPRLSDSVDQALHAIVSGEIQGSSSEPHIAESVPSEVSDLPPKQVLDGEVMEELKLNSDDGSVEVKANEVVSSVELSSEKQISALAAEKPDHETEAFKDSHLITSVEGKGKISKSSSPSSSSTSDSSSSDSDRE